MKGRQVERLGLTSSRQRFECYADHIRMSSGAASSIERLGPSDAPDNVALSRSVGWQDVESDWRVLHEAAEVLGVRQDGRVIVQGALGDYGNSATLAKMVVAPEHQRRRLGASLLDHFVAGADARGIPIGLCATELGRPLYASRGFAVSGELVIVHGTPTSGRLEIPNVGRLLDVTRALQDDLRMSRCDRARMLRARYREAAASVAFDDGRRGFGMATQQPGLAVIGPILAENAQDARQLCQALLAAVAGPVRIDVPLQHVELRRWLVELGLREVSVRVEMARGASTLPWQTDQRFALATQAWG